MAAQSNQDSVNQQREFVRIDDMLPLSWRKITEEELSEILAYFEKNREFPPKQGDLNTLLASLDVNDKLKQLERNDPTLARILGRLDMKLNVLIRLFHPGDQQQPMAPTPVNLSGGGLAIWEEETGLAIGDVLQLRLAFSPDALASIECYARVVFIRPNDRDGLDKLALNFEPILAADREAIVQHIFKRQTERLRAKKRL